MEFLGQVFVNNPHLELLHLKWEFNFALHGIVPVSVKFLKVCVLENATEFVLSQPPAAAAVAGQHHHLGGQPPALAACFQTVRALAVESRHHAWKELISTSFSKF
jgi:hypothetical protein